MSCKCNNKNTKMVDVTCLIPIPWDEAASLLGMDECDDFQLVDKPEFEITAEDREKLDALNITGDGSSALYNNGEYQPTYTTTQVDEIVEPFVTQASIDEQLADVVRYDEAGDLSPTGDIVLTNGREFAVRNEAGDKTAIITHSEDTIAIGAIDESLYILAASRPRISTAEGDSERIAYLAEVQNAQQTADQANESIATTNENVTALTNTVDGKEDVSNKVAISSSAEAGQYPTAVSVWSLVQDVAATIPAGGLKVPISEALESALPDVATLEVGDFFIVENMDVTSPNHNGRVWVNYSDPSDTASALEYYRVVDQYHNPDNISIILTGSGALEVSDSYLDSFVNDALVPVNRQIQAVDETLTSSINSVSTRTLVLESQVSSLNGQVSSIDSMVGGINSRVNSIDGRLSTAEGNITRINGQVNTNTAALSGKVDNGGGVSAIQTFATTAEAEEYSAANPTVMCIALS